MIDLYVIFLLVLTLTILLYLGHKRENFYLSFFPYCSNYSRTNLIQDNLKPDNVKFEEKEIIFKFPNDTSREQMINYVGDFFKSKINGIYKNTIVIKIERISNESSDFFPIDLKKISDKDYEIVNLVIGYIDNNNYKFSHYGKAQRTKYISAPSSNKFVKYPLKFEENSVKIEINKAITPIPILYFMHYYFDDFYCRGKYENKDFKVKGTNFQDSITRHVVEVGNLEDCAWGKDNSKVNSCKINTDAELLPNILNIEPDNIQSGYRTPSKLLNICNVKKVYLNKWDGRGVPISNFEKKIEMKEFLPHPALFQNKLDGLYDDAFDMSRIIPSFPTGRSSVGR